MMTKNAWDLLHGDCCFIQMQKKRPTSQRGMEVIDALEAQSYREMKR